MKKFITPILCLFILLTTFIFLSPITDSFSSLISDETSLVLKPQNNYTKNKDYLYVQRTNDYVPYSFQDLLNIYYSVIDNGWDQFTFYCPEEYTNCLNDAAKISDDELILTHLNNYVHPFNSFTNIKSRINPSGEITLQIYYLYNDYEKKVIDEKADEVLNKIIKDDMDDYDKIKTVHDYVINNTKYDVERNEKNESKYNSYKAYGPLIEGFATCNGYTDLMAIYLTKMGYDNFKVATTPDEISYSATGHIWNAVYVNNKWLHIDLTWDDPVDENKDYLFHTYFLVTTEAMKKADDGQTVLEEHNFNKLYYLEFNNEQVDEKK